MSLQGPGLYIHIPFCKKKCPYCSFYSIETNKIDDSNIDNKFHQIFDDYVNALLNQARLFSQFFRKRPFVSIYLGGGTPSLLGAKRINTLVTTLLEILDFIDKPEITIEVNPNDGSSFFFNTIKSSVNRVSLGIQSFQKSTLRALGRRHTPDQAFSAIKAAVDSGLKVSGDLIFNVLNQGLGEFAEDLSLLIESGVGHLSLYDLHVEPGVPMYPLENQDEELNFLMYEYAIKRLSSANIKRYEVSNFSLPGYESIHNLVYWSGRDFLGLGAGASGYIRPFKVNVEKSVKTYIDHYSGLSSLKVSSSFEQVLLEHSKFLSCEVIHDSIDEQMDEFMFMGLRKKAGIRDFDFIDLFKTSFYTIYNKSIKKLVFQGLLDSGKGSINLTEKGFMLGNRVFMEFIR